MARKLSSDFVEGKTTFGEYPAVEGDFLDFHLCCVVFGCCGGKSGVEGKLSETIMPHRRRESRKEGRECGKVNKTQ